MNDGIDVSGFAFKCLCIILKDIVHHVRFLIDTYLCNYIQNAHLMEIREATENICGQSYELILRKVPAVGW